MEAIYLFENGRCVALVEEPGHLVGLAGVLLGDQDLEPWAKENLYGRSRQVSGPMVHERPLRDRALWFQRRLEPLVDVDGQSVVPESDALAGLVAEVHELIEEFEDEGDNDYTPHPVRQLEIAEDDDYEEWLMDELSYELYLEELFSGYCGDENDESDEHGLDNVEVTEPVRDRFEHESDILDENRARFLREREAWQQERSDGIRSRCRENCYRRQRENRHVRQRQHYQCWKHSYYRKFQRHGRNTASGRLMAQAWIEQELRLEPVLRLESSVQDQLESLRELRFRLDAHRLLHELDLLEFWEFDAVAETLCLSSWSEAGELAL